ncbi:MFS transporter [Chloroflexota bacterium]
MVDVKPVTPAFGYRWVILGVCWLAYITAVMLRLSMGPLAPFIKEDLNLTSAQVGLFMSAATFGYGLIMVPAGWLTDRIGVRWLLLMGGVFGGIFVASMFTVTTFTQGLILLAFAGMGMGCLMPSTTKAIVVWFPLKERATAMGLKQMAIDVAGIITATTLPAVALALSWHYGFLGIGLIAVAMGIVSFLLYREPPQSAGLNTSKAVIPSGTGPSVREIFRSRDIWLVVVGGTCMVLVEFSVLGYFVLYLKEVMLFTVVTAGFLLAILDAGGAFGRPIAGLISDRLFHGSRKGVLILMWCMALVMCVIFAFLPQGSPLWLIVPLGLVFGFGGISFGALHLTLAGEFAGKELVGTVTGITAAFALIGGMAGPPVFGYIVDTTGSYKSAWQFLAIMALLAVVLLFFVREGKKKI